MLEEGRGAGELRLAAGRPEVVGKGMLLALALKQPMRRNVLEQGLSRKWDRR